MIEIPDPLPNLVGQIPQEDLDLVVDCQDRKRIPNPEHKNGVMYDEFGGVRASGTESGHRLSFTICDHCFPASL